MATLRGMLRVLLWFGQFLVVAPSVYESVISLWGLRTPPPIAPSPGRTLVRVIVAAHDEEAVIEGIAGDLAGQDYPPELLESWVVADRCTDDTAVKASSFVHTAERFDGGGGKGGAIAWLLADRPLGDDEVLVVLDADNRIDPQFISSVAAAFEDGHHAIQTYLDVANPDSSPVTTASALTYWASNRSVQLARSNLGWSCDLGGTGMAITSHALAAVGGFTDELTEDLSLNIRLNLAGYRTHWLHHTRVNDEKPVDANTAVHQRARWARGKSDVRRAYGPILLRRAIGDRQPALFDLWIRLYNPGRSLLALLLVVLTVLAFVSPDSGLWSGWLLGMITIVVLALPLVFLVIDRVPTRYLIRYPYVVVIALMWVPVRVAGRFVGSWRRTPHGGA